ncbi:ATP-dependent zinc metalloprotease FtsH 4 [Stieleria bergensis]|uniref:ATP-dependent zinc metalloprotease FtsH n=1 Tax=Stieleria bergensis TaxID=2528025 RepID=A0A517SW11_9BACT|nr:ATP-dependent zinc metalloprotease FtsH 4 [Planctomycetes bacterium SV_7m_r]
MSEKKRPQKESKDQNKSPSRELRSGSGIWIILILVVLFVLVSVSMLGRKGREMRYQTLMTMLNQHAERNASEDSAAKSQAIRIEVTSPRDPELIWEFSELQSLELSETKVTGTVMFRSLGNKGADRNNPENIPAKSNFYTFIKVNSEQQDRDLQAAIDQSGILWDNDDPNQFLAKNWFNLVMLGAFLFIAFMIMRRVSGAGSPMSFSRSRGKLHGQEDLSLGFADAAGIDEAVEEVREVVDFLKNAEKYQELGGRIPKGVLLVGPPGTGKTLLARAIAGEAGVPFFSLSGSDFVEMFVGVGAARVRDMFQQATSRAPCIIFIDELDALGKSRSGSVAGGHDEREQTLNALLVEMDGFQPNNGVIVIAATNRPETLDPALLRPGRFDRQVLVDRPDVAGREEILNVHVKQVRLDNDVNLRRIASITSGFVGADLANLVNEAALLAARANKTAVSAEEFDEAVDRVTAGLEKKNRVMNEDEKIRIAYHEAAHALVAAALPNTDPVHKVSIIPRGFAALGYTMQRPDSERYLMTKGELESRMKVLLAGTLAEEMVLQDISTGAQNDLERCTEIARSMVMDYGMSQLGRINYRQKTGSAFLAGAPGQVGASQYGDNTARKIDVEVARMVEQALADTREILQQREEVLEAITQRLLEVESIDNTELMRLIEEHNSGPWLVPGTETKKPRAQIRKPDPDSDTLSESENLKDAE